MFRPIHGHHQVDCLKFPLCNRAMMWRSRHQSLLWGSIGSISEERWMETKTITKTICCYWMTPGAEIVHLVGFHYKSACFLSDFNRIWFVWQILVNSRQYKFTRKSVQREPTFSMPTADGWTNMKTLQFLFTTRRKSLKFKKIFTHFPENST